MRIAKIIYKKKKKWGILEDDSIIILKEPPFNSFKLTKEKIPLSKVKFLVPASPTKIVLVGLNYKDHAKELKMRLPKEPIIFLKPPSTLIAHKESIIYPKGVKRLDYEAEVAVVIKKKVKGISPQRVREYILGYTCLNDVTARNLQKKDIQWTRAKSFDTFCPCGPYVNTDFSGNLRIRTYLNGVLKQDSSTSNFIFPIEKLVSFISKIMTLYPGDIVSTGTPSGIGPMKGGDAIEIVVDGISPLCNRVVFGS